MPSFTPAAILPARLLENAKVLPTRNDILPLLPKGCVFCEVGVALGDFSQRVLDICGVSRLIAIDIFTLDSYPDMWDGRVGEVLGGLNHRDYYASRFKDAVAQGVVRLMEGNSTDMLASLADQSVDVFYVDAYHDYESVHMELEIILSKITASGIIVLNDYIMHDYTTDTPYGVVRATNEFMLEHDWEMVYLALHTGMFCDVAIQRKRTAAVPLN